MKKQALDSLIDKYILGTLTKAEKSQLEAYIMKNPKTQLEIQMREDLTRGLEYNAEQELKTLLDKIHSEEIDKTKRNRPLKTIGLTALLIAVVAALYLLFNIISSPNEPKPINNNQLYASYFEPYNTSVETRNSEETLSEEYISFIEAYRAKEYEKCLELVGALLSRSDNNILLLAGISALESDNPQLSINYFDQIIESDDFFFTDHARWYKALAKLKLNKIEESKEILQEITNDPKADHHDDSVALLKEI